jgi:uncharacterized protein (DUF885 family)
MRSLLVLTLLATACATTPTPGPPPPREEPPPAPTASAQLSSIADRLYENNLRDAPVWATFKGERKYDRELNDVSRAAQERRRKESRQLLAELSALQGALSAQEDVTRELLRYLLQLRIDSEVCEEELWDVSPLNGVQSLLGQLPRLHVITDRDHSESLKVRYAKAGALVDQHVQNLREGVKAKLFATRVSVDRVIAQLERMLQKPAGESAFVLEVVLPPSFSAEDQARIRKELADEVTRAVHPALSRYLSFLRNEYLPYARTEVGIRALPNGDACYAARRRGAIGLDVSAEEVHQIGLRELQRNEEAMRAIAKKRVGRADIDLYERALRKDKSQQLKTREEVVEHARRTIERAQAVLPRVFAKLPKHQVDVKPIEAFREHDSPLGYYLLPPRDGTRPGYFYVNTAEGDGRLAYLFEALTFHEAVPGHHLQMASALELEGVPRIRQEAGSPAFVEGWAHYAELLADELGLYSGDAGRFGMLSDQALRAVRLVLDTGVHALGWNRDQALKFMIDHTAVPPDEAAREVDRYIGWPGQALAYKMGQLELLKLRAEAKEKLAARFDLKAFHQQLLSYGPIPLPVLRQQMERWVSAQQ